MSTKNSIEHEAFNAKVRAFNLKESNELKVQEPKPMQLFELINAIAKGMEFESELTEAYKKIKDKTSARIKELHRLKNIITAAGLDPFKIQIAEQCIEVKGNPYGRTDAIAIGQGVYISTDAIYDIAAGCSHLKHSYYGNKTYEGFYQKANNQYGYGPRHGGIVDKISLKPKYRAQIMSGAGASLTQELTPEQKDACIYYLVNYREIMEVEKL